MAERTDATQDIGGGSGGNSRRVYLLEPQDTSRTKLTNLISSAGYTVEAFSTLPELLARIKTQAPDCVVADSSPPDALGSRLLAQLPAAKRPPVMLIALDSEMADAVHAIRAGAADFLEKPLMHALLLSRLYRLTGKPVARNQRAD